MPFTPYIHFNECCAEAMAFYAEIFGTAPPEIMMYSDAPPEVGMGDHPLVLHSSITLGDGTQLMASDNPPDMPHPPQQAISIAYSCDTVDQAAAIFEKLDAEGDVIMPFGPTFFSPGFGMTRDKFGTHWMIMGPDPSS